MLAFSDGEMEREFLYEFAEENMENARTWLIVFCGTELSYCVYFFCIDQTVNCLPSVLAACLYLMWGLLLRRYHRFSVRPEIAGRHMFMRMFNKHVE